VCYSVHKGGITVKFRYPIGTLIVVFGICAVISITTGEKNIPGGIAAITLEISKWWIIGIAVYKILWKIRETALHCSQAHYEQHKEKQANKMQIIERELDEIETSLNAVTSDEKVTPIWELPKKKP